MRAATWQLQALRSVWTALSAVTFTFFTPVVAHSFPLTTSVETAETVLGAGWQTITFENSYTNPIAVCSYVLANSSNQPAVVRMQSLGSTSMQIRLQEFENSSLVTPGTVSCLIAEEGVNNLPDGGVIEARSTLSDNTHGRFNWNLATMENMSSDFTHNFSSPIALAQVMTFNDVRASVAHVNDCEARGNPAFNSGFGDGICATKHIGSINSSRLNETVGVIAIESATSRFRGVAYQAGRGGNSIAGVGNNPPYSYNLSDTYDIGVVQLAGENGGDGAWAVLYGNNPLAGNQIDLAVEEEDFAGDTSRRHINEQVDFFVARPLPYFDLEKTVDLSTVSEPQTLTYTLTLTNPGEFDLTGISITDTLPDSSTATLVGPVETGGTTAGVLEIDEVWTYTTTYAVTGTDVSNGTNLTNTVVANAAQYAPESIVDETDTAVTTITPPAPSATITKTADDTTDVPSGQLVTYTYQVTNNGNVTLLNVNLSDVHNGSGPAPTPANEVLSADVGTIGDSTDATPNDGIWDRLAIGDTITFTASYLVTQTDIETLQ